MKPDQSAETATASNAGNPLTQPLADVLRMLQAAHMSLGIHHASNERVIKARKALDAAKDEAIKPMQANGDAFAAFRVIKAEAADSLSGHVDAANTGGLINSIESANMAFHRIAETCDRMLASEKPEIPPLPATVDLFEAVLQMVTLKFSDYSEIETRLLEDAKQQIRRERALVGTKPGSTERAGYEAGLLAGIRNTPRDQWPIFENEAGDQFLRGFEIARRG